MSRVLVLALLLGGLVDATHWDHCADRVERDPAPVSAGGEDEAEISASLMESRRQHRISASLMEWRRQRSRGRPCGVGEHTDGRWLYKTAGELTAHAPCCDLSKEEQRDTAVCGPHPMPLEVHFPPSADILPENYHFWDYQFTSGRSDFLVHARGNGCSCDDWVDHYSWEPARCSLATWNASKFCDALGGRTILFVGDSTMMQTGVAVINSVHWGMWNGSGCQEQISAGLSDTLIGRGLGGANRGGVWTAWVNHFAAISRNFSRTSDSLRAARPPNRRRERTSHERPREGAAPDIVVLSAGAHVSLLADFESILDQVVHQHRTLFPEVKLVWQTSPGAGCAFLPLEAAPDETFWALQTKRYNWPRFAAFDAAARTRFAHPAESENRYLLDVSPLALRADAHPSSGGNWGPMGPDCLHSCLPGPLDSLVPRTLLHLMLHHAL